MNTFTEISIYTGKQRKGFIDKDDLVHYNIEDQLMQKLRVEVLKALESGRDVELKEFLDDLKDFPAPYSSRVSDAAEKILSGIHETRTTEEVFSKSLNNQNFNSTENIVS